MMALVKQNRKLMNIFGESNSSYTYYPTRVYYIGDIFINLYRSTRCDVLCAGYTKHHDDGASDDTLHDAHHRHSYCNTVRGIHDASPTVAQDQVS